jgi:hypothetical protein
MIFSKITDSDGSQNGCLPNLVRTVAGGNRQALMAILYKKSQFFFGSSSV